MTREQDLAAQVAAQRVRLAQALAFLEREGYRSCDIPACNCGSWHAPERPASQGIGHWTHAELDEIEARAKKETE